MKKRLAILGGGAAGYFAAINTAELNPHLSVVLIEGSRQLLTKVRVSGGGRCNVTHACFDPAVLVQSYPRGQKELRGPFSKFQPQETLAWFARRGVELKTESDGRIFPVTNSSQTIIDCFQKAARETGVEVRLGCKAVGIKKISSSFLLQFTERKSEEETFDFILLATGSSPSGYSLAKSLGHTLSPPVPSLFTFNIRDPRLKGLEGVSFPEVSLSLDVSSTVSTTFQQRGPLLITHWGLSGPAVLKLSALAARDLFHSSYQAQLKINFFPQESASSIEAKLRSYKLQNPKKTLVNGIPFPCPKRYWARLLQLLHLPNLPEKILWADLNKEGLLQLRDELVAAQFQVQGKGVFKEEFVTCGGINLKEINFQTMESRLCPGLYFAGEILDIDGITGGFNFQNAWTTGWIAAQSLGLGLGKFTRD